MLIRKACKPPECGPITSLELCACATTTVARVEMLLGRNHKVRCVAFVCCRRGRRIGHSSKRAPNPRAATNNRRYDGRTENGEHTPCPVNRGANLGGCKDQRAQRLEPKETILKTCDS